MTFNNINNGDPLDATKAMENWRHTNYGSPLLPVNSSGVAVDDTIDMGSSSAGFKDGFFTGKLTVGSQPYFLADSGSATSNGNVTNLVQVTNVGAFTLESGKITIPFSGILIVSVNALMTGNDLAEYRNNLALLHYNSEDALQRTSGMCSGQGYPNLYGSGAVILLVNTGDYLYVKYSESGGFDCSQVQISILGWPS